jgi:hypothetical protein
MIGGDDATTVSVDIQRPFERRWNIAQTAIHGLILLALAAGCLGLFGSAGPFGTKTVPVPGTEASLTYERFLRRGAQTRFKLAMDPTTPGSTVTVNFSREFLDRLAIATTLPRAMSVQADKGGLTYTFAAVPGAVIEIVARPSGLGWTSPGFGILGTHISIDQFVWP